ncbi:uncharacterized protein [Bemisia tabaci]|uniref:uncharacterized protein n=1 Tax=Bemisia tabaci TaxID=7038 RepID=UPI0008F9C782|nr:PREDICTED: uncharacterized protein LOC109035690 [Bemisia tabaci]
MDIEISSVFRTFRGKRCVIIELYKLTESNVLQSGNIRFRCANKKCGASVLVDETVKKVIQPSAVEHNHEPYTSEEITKQKFKVSVKRKAAENLIEKPSKIIRRELLLDGACELSNLELPGIRKMMYKERKKSLPAPIPKSRQEAYCQLYDLQRKILVKGQQFCFVNAAKNMVILTCESNLKLMQVSELFFGDGTFSYAPDHFSQLYTIHVYKNCFYIPVAFCFLPSKSCETYRLMWRELQNLSLSLTGKNFVIPTFYADFESAAHNAIHAEFPDCMLLCCRFHLSQSWFRFIQSNSFLLREYNTKGSAVGKWLRYFFGLPLLPPNEVLGGFLDLMSIVPDGIPQETQTEFSNYLLNNYILTLSKYPPDLWAGPPSNCPRTTNGNESFHSNYNKEFYHTHPNIHNVVEVLRQIQAETLTKITSVNMNVTNTIKQPTIDRNNYAIEAWNTYAASKRDREARLTYLKRLGHHFQAKKI